MTITLSEFVHREIIVCCSALISTLTDAASKIGELDDGTTYDELLNLQQWRNWEEAAREHIETMDRQELVDALEAEDVEDARGIDEVTAALNKVVDLMENDEEGDDGTDFPGLSSPQLREMLLAHLDSSDSVWEEFCNEHDLEPEDEEIYEHWVVTHWLADKLAAHGEVTNRSICGLTIWGRGTTGQAITMDHVIQQIYTELTGVEVTSADY